MGNNFEDWYSDLWSLADNFRDVPIIKMPVYSAIVKIYFIHTFFKKK